LGTDPTQQRTGAGRALLQWGIDKSEAEQVDLLLEATEGSLASSSFILATRRLTTPCVSGLADVCEFWIR
jgi:hypothetical protein